MKYSDKLLKEVDSIQFDDIIFLPLRNEFEVKYKIRLNQKTRRWQCTCFNQQFGVAQNRYCKHILSILKKYDIVAYEKEIGVNNGK